MIENSDVYGFRFSGLAHIVEPAAPFVPLPKYCKGSLYLSRIGKEPCLPIASIDRSDDCDRANLTLLRVFADDVAEGDDVFRRKRVRNVGYLE